MMGRAEGGGALSVREQDRQRRIEDEMTRHAAEDHLAQAALRIGALDDQVGAAGDRGVDDRLAGRAVARRRPPRTSDA